MFNKTMKINILFSSILLFLPLLLLASAPFGLFNQFPNRYFVETGSYEGLGIEKALQGRFSEIHSIEIVSEHYKACQNKFSSFPNVHLWCGDSAILLASVIAPMREPITFWLDGHWSGGMTGRGLTNTPILHELETIRKHPIKNHTILIDDVRCFGTEDFDHIMLSTIIKMIQEINPDYTITFVNGHQKNDILVAKINEKVVSD